MGPHSEAAACSPLSPFLSAFDCQIIPLSTEIAAHAKIGWPAPSSHLQAPAWSVKSRGLSTRLTGCATAVWMHFMLLLSAPSALFFAELTLLVFVCFS